MDNTEDKTIERRKFLKAAPPSLPVPLSPLVEEFSLIKKKKKEQVPVVKLVKKTPLK